ncbi:hypothetical protein [Rhodococcus sp. JVH1]|uniref:hypothetical protein n=1 Tax=Rhodococcus sp. JVH1 TaxID=745408 RepID=UPI0002720CD2|nr:hypothetical protein [Rhodococcus sp. JVH1]EJJ02104.1 hypothetical protein JVH1_0317 [Rhodococcus sp. JVH1]
MPKTIIPVIGALWLALAAIGAWSTIAFAIAAPVAVLLGTYLPANAVTGPETAEPPDPRSSNVLYCNHFGDHPP